jgi:peptide/nickel transport system substrate-binding protein
MKLKRRFLFLLLLVIIPLAAIGVHAQDDTTVVVRNIGNLTTFNPILYSDGASIIAAHYLWPQLFEVDRFTGQPIPGLTTWEVSEDNLTYRFTIRDNAFWSDGTPITSADAKFVIDATADTNVPSPRRNNTRNIAAVNIIDDRTFEIVLNRPTCVVWSDFINFRLVPSARFAADFSDMATNALATAPDVSGGPYILEQSVTGEFQRYRINPTYWGAPATIPTLINRVIQDPAITLQALQAGEIDYASLRGDEFEQLVDTSRLNFAAFPQNNVSFLAMNWVDPENPQPAYDADGNLVAQTPHPIFSDVRVRRAIAMAWNKADVLATLGGENGGTIIASSVLPSLTWAVNPDIQPYPFDPEAAAALLDEAGWVINPSTGIREKDGVPLAFEIAYSDLLRYFETIALVAQDYFTRLGMDVTLTKLEWATYLNEVFLGQRFDIAVLSNSGPNPPDPDSLARGLTYSRNDVPGSGGNVVSYVNPEYDALLDAAAAVPGCDPAARAELYYQIQQIQHEQVIYDFVLSPNLIQVMNSRIGGFEPGPWWGLYGFTQHINEWRIGD